MATPQRLPGPDLIALTQARRFAHGDDFFEVVRLLERQALLTADGESGRIGGDGPPAAEPLRFQTSQERGFPIRSIEAITAIEGSGERVALRVALLGLTGPSGVLPAPYGELVQQQLRQRDSALADFLDLFNHRLIGLYYRAWAKYRPSIQYEVHLRQRDTEPFQRVLQSLAGPALPTTCEARHFYAGHFARATRSASDLARLASDLLAAPVRVDGFVGQWLTIAPPDRLRIGTAGRGRNNGLAAGITPGHRVWDMQSKIVLQLGPLSDAEFAGLVPGARRFRDLKQVLHNYVPAHLDIELLYLVRGDRLSALGRGTRLGRNCWLRSDHSRLRTARIQLHRTSR